MIKSCFKAYDIRGETPSPISDEFSFNLGRSLACYLNASCIVVGYDVRKTSKSLARSLIEALLKHGVNIINIGLCGTEEVYFATCFYKANGGVMVTASHNPSHHNGFKIVGKNALPIYQERGFKELYNMMRHASYAPFSKKEGRETHIHDKKHYIHHLLSIVPASSFTPMTIVTNAGNGSAGLVIDQLEQHLPLNFIKTQHEPDGTFPYGVPNPLLPHMREKTKQAVLTHKADLAIAWDGDFDRCFFYDHEGKFIHNHYIIGLLSHIILSSSVSPIVTDTRLFYYLNHCIQKHQTSKDTPSLHVLSRSGHSFMKESMRKHNAIYGGEKSGHHYFRDFFYCDSGMLPWLFLISYLSQNHKKLHEIVAKAQYNYPCSEEINIKVSDYQNVKNVLLHHFHTTYHSKDELDGLTLTFKSWRFNIRPSQTENIARLNIESNQINHDITHRIKQIQDLIAPFLL